MTIVNKNIVELLLAGNSTVTLVKRETGNHYTYNIKQCDSNPELYFIRLLRGPDNTADYTYIGCYYSDNNYFHIAKDYSHLNKKTRPSSIQAIASYLTDSDYRKHIDVYHEGKCCRCGRKLTTPQNIEEGIGPECKRYL